MLDQIVSLNSEYFTALKTMSGSGIEWIDLVFRFCVVFLVDTARFLGMSYEELNIWVFIILQPALIVLFFALWRREKRRSGRLLADNRS